MPARAAPRGDFLSLHVLSGMASDAAEQSPLPAVAAALFFYTGDPPDPADRLHRGAGAALCLFAHRPQLTRRLFGAARLADRQLLQHPGRGASGAAGPDE